ncbi:MAG: T9SS type A sorting domain-containing protein [Bacteroidales bacterium]
MKKIILIIFVIFLTVSNNFAQLTGTKTIPGNYPSLASAINALNTQGVGSGGVTFNIAAGYTETLGSLNAGLITASGTASNPIIFKKINTGNNPVISGFTAAPGSTDYIIALQGTDYITFDGIDLADPTGAIEWGYAVLKASASNGSQYVTIKNSNITLNKTNTGTYGIYSDNVTPSAPTTELTITASSGSNSNNKFFNNNFVNCYSGICLWGFYNDASPFSFYDQNVEVGKDGANTFSDYGGGSVSAYGIYAGAQNNITIANNTFSGIINNTFATAYGISLSYMKNANCNMYNNHISLTYNGFGHFYGIYHASNTSGTSNTSNIYNNTIANCAAPNATSNSWNGFWVQGGKTTNFYGNSVTNNIYGSSTTPATGVINYIYLDCAQDGAYPGQYNVYNNTVSNNSRIQMTPGSGIGYYLYVLGSGLGTINVHNNTIENQSAGSTGNQYGLYIRNWGASNIYNNTISNILNSNGGIVHGIYNYYGVGECKYYNNKIDNLNGLGANSRVYGIYHLDGPNTYYYNNFISGLNAPAASHEMAIAGMYFAAGTFIGAYYNTIYLNASSSSADFGSAGIYAGTAQVVDLRNNIIVNNSTPGGPGALTVALRYANPITATNYAQTSNNNNFYAGPPSQNNLIYYDGQYMDQILETFKVRVAPRDAASVTENPPFINNTVAPYDLHLNSNVQTLCGDRGTPVITPIAVTTDYDSNLRNLSMPDIGADEFVSLPYPTITGPSSVCNESIGNVYTTEAGYTGYSWLISPGGIITAGGSSGDNVVTVTWTVSGTQTVSVNYNNSAGLPAPVPTIYNVTVNAILPVNVNILASSNPVCEGLQVTYTAYPTNGGPVPGYQWQLNGNNVGNNSAVYSGFPVNGDLVRCILTSNQACISGNPDTSNTLAMTVNPTLPVSVSIVADNNPVTGGTPATFTAFGINGGTNPFYQWRVNGVNVGANSTQYSYVPLNGDMVTCIFTSGEMCVTINPATSNTIVVTVITGTDDLSSAGELQKFTLNPNPSYGKFLLERYTNLPAGTLTVEVYSMMGERVFNESFPEFIKHEFDLTNVPVGIYFIHLKAEGSTRTLKLVKTR